MPTVVFDLVEHRAHRLDVRFRPPGNDVVRPVSGYGRLVSDPASTDRVFRWGLNLLPDASAGRVAELARWAEGLGFDRCWLYDEGLATRDLYVCLAAIASATDRIELGPGITNPYTRHPSVAASAVASLQELSGGRAFLGLGAGGSLTLDPVALERSRPAATLVETIDACRALFSGETVRYEGDIVRLRGARIDYGSSGTAIWVAGRGRRVLAAGAEHADGVSLDHIHREFIGAEVEHVRAAARDAGREVEIAYSATIVTDEPALERLRAHMTYRLVDSPEPVREAIELGPERVDAIRAAMADGLDAAAGLVEDRWVFPFVVHGSPQECARQVSDMCSEHGFSEFTVPVPDLEFAEETISTGAEVLRLVDD